MLQLDFCGLHRWEVDQKIGLRAFSNKAPARLFCFSTCRGLFVRIQQSVRQRVFGSVGCRFDSLFAAGRRFDSVFGSVRGRFSGGFASMDGRFRSMSGRSDNRFSSGSRSGYHGIGSEESESLRAVFCLRRLFEATAELASDVPSCISFC